MKERMDNNFEQEKSREEMIQTAKSFSLFELTYENPSLSRDRIKDMPELAEVYEEWDKFIDQAYLRGKVLDDPSFVETVWSVFARTHQSGFGIREYLEKTQEPETMDFFEENGATFLRELTGGGETEIYQHLTCEMK